MCGDGYSGLEAAERWRPDRLIQDLVLPGMDGYAVLEELRRSPRLNGLPVLLISAASHRPPRPSRSTSTNSSTWPTR